MVVGVTLLGDAVVPKIYRRCRDENYFSKLKQAPQYCSEACCWQLEAVAASALLSKQMLPNWDAMVCAPWREGGRQQPCRKADSVSTTFPRL